MWDSTLLRFYDVANNDAFKKKWLMVQHLVFVEILFHIQTGCEPVSWPCGGKAAGLFKRTNVLTLDGAINQIDQEVADHITVN